MALAGLASCQLVFPLEGPKDSPPADVPPDHDGDGDTIPDLADNCVAIQNTDQHDEDDDEIGDACDNCPHVANADQDNDDGDGLGNVCDDSEMIDCIARFDPFTAFDRWIDVSGSWGVENDRLIQRDANLAGGALVVTADAYAFVAMKTAGTVLQTGAVEPQLVAAWTGLQQLSPIAGISSELRDPALSAKSALLVTHFFDNGSSNLLAQRDLLPLKPISANDRFTLSVDQRLVNTLVSTTTLTSTNESTASAMVSVDTQAGGIGLSTFKASVAFDYLLIVERAGALPCP